MASVVLSSSIGVVTMCAAIDKKRIERALGLK
jgi:hypothetical protein